jgi:glycosyltransferase involved in cell wall biosynthesis
MPHPGVTAVIPAHTPRLADGSLRRAVASVLTQAHPVTAITIAVDTAGDGAAVTRQRALDMARTEWVAFLDADDWWYPNHLGTLLQVAEETGADYVHAWWDGNQPFSESTHRGQRGWRMNPATSHHTTMTVLVRTGLAQEVGFRPHPDAGQSGTAEDWLFTLGCLDRGAVFAAVPDVTWHYEADGHNTSGLAARWTPDRVQADVTVVIPHIPIRRDELLRALDSVWAQTVLPAAVSIAVDLRHEGSAAARNRALDAAATGWVAFLDDDDEVHPNHVHELVWCQKAVGADVVYTGCVVLGPDGREVPVREEWGRFGRSFDAGLLRRRPYLPVTCLANTRLAQQARFQCPPGSDYDDHGFHLAMLDAGAQYVHHPIRSWTWYHTGFGQPGRPGNTSGRGDRW